MAVQTKAELQKANEKIMCEVMDLRNDAIRDTQEKSLLLKEVRRLKLAEQEHLAVEHFLRQGVLNLEEKLADMNKDSLHCS